MEMTRDPAGPAILGNRVELQLLTTLRCNLKCSYCSLGVGDVLGSQRNVTYSLDALDAFIATHLNGHEIYVTFYGGEPTLNPDLMIEVMQRHPGFRFQLQTNGTLLDGLPDWVLARLSNVLVSIDGGEQVTDGYRGRGIYQRVLKNVGAVRERVGGTLTARVTWSDEDTSFEELDQLRRYFDYVYFQFVARDGAYAPAAMAKKRAVMAQLVQRFFAAETLYPFIPIMGTVRNKVLPSRAREPYSGLTQCRASTHMLNVMPDGKIYPCPDLMYLPEMLQGDVAGNWLKRSPLQPHPDMPCEGCAAFAYCRRNCMKNLHLAYVKGDAAYRRNVVEPICDLVRFLGEEVDRHDPHAWFERMPLSVRNEVADCAVYEYVEVMP
ncbi:MAG: radical SAM protein [Betaproteobacteria bacterium RIFCSPLOWO2_12_FULL_64_23]|nr:MAG: radical SAM protein [Betaproteobacteria bacterium RIFCSPLOWO2_12_FULL_64_23]